MRCYRLPNGVEHEIDGSGAVLARFPDGHEQQGLPQFGDEHIARARQLGYQGTDREVVLAMTADHDLLHSIIALNIDGGESHALRWARDGVSEPGRIPTEERLVFLVQRALNCRDAAELLAPYRA